MADTIDEINSNPLDVFASYNYQISWYATTPEAYDQFVQSGGTNVTFSDSKGASHALLIAQSGGIHNDERAVGFELDYYIDNLRLDEIINSGGTSASVDIREINFDIIEPYGFSLVSNLKRALDQLKSVSSTPGYNEAKNPTRGFFALGIRFQGFDIAGNIVTDESGAPYIYEKYYGIQITELKFKLDGKPVVYHIKAQPINQQAVQTKYGTINTNIVVSGTTVADALEDLKRQLNSQQQISAGKSQNNITQPIHYDFTFEGEGADKIANARIVVPTDTDKSKTEGSGAKNTNDSNPKTASAATYNPNSKQIQFKDGTSVLQAVEQIISQSTYVLDAMKQKYTTALEPNSNTGAPEQLAGTGTGPLRWYKVTPRVTNPRRDPNISDYAYDITYVIQPYKTPVTMAAGVGKTDDYPGPVKRYEYWFSGQNSEVLNFEVQFENLFFNVALEAGNSSSAANADVPQVINRPTQFGVKLGERGYAPEPIRGYITSLYDIQAWSEGKITIMGDPDWIMNPEASRPPNSGKVDGDGRTVNPRAGQVFIEINFYEGYDYDHDLGLFQINDSIFFVDYPESIQSGLLKRGGGVIYMVTEVISYFRGGKFTQELTLKQAAFGNTGKTDNKPPAAQVTGLKPDQ